MKNILLAVIALLLVGITSVKATTYTAVASGSWSSSSTWLHNSGTPTASDTVIIPSPYTVTSSSSISMGTTTGGKLTISRGGELDLGSNGLTINNSVVVTINGTLNSGAVELNASVKLTNSGTITTGSIQLDDATTFNNTGTVNAGTLQLNSTSVFTDNGTMTISTSIAINASSDLIVDASRTLNDQGSFDDNSSTTLTDNGAILVTGTATFYGGSDIGGTGYLTGGEIQEYHNTTVWGTPASYFPCTNCTIPHTSPLPISLIAFNANYDNDAVQVTWSTATETNNNYFTVSRSNDGVNYTIVATVKGSGNSTEQQNYSCTDLTAPDGVNYYRLQQTDYDGTTTTDAISVVTINVSDKTARIIPNPVKDNCIVAFNDNVNEYFQLSVYDFMGRQVMAQLVQAIKGSNAIEINTSALAQGMYIVSLPVQGNAIKVKLIKH